MVTDHSSTPAAISATADTSPNPQTTTERFIVSILRGTPHLSFDDLVDRTESCTTTVRQAVRSLSIMGLIEADAHDGTYSMVRKES